MHTETITYDRTVINAALDYTRSAVNDAILALVEEKRAVPGAYQPLYDILADYPLRRGKSLRPTMCISTARAAGGSGHLALTASAALELYHNAFLIHDDIEDGSESRRGKETLHALVGIPRAVNAGDATNVLAVSLLVNNLTVVGVTKALHVLHEVEHMARQAVEGQAMELDWVARNACDLGDRDYFMMCAKKTCWYSFITPMRIGFIIGSPAAQAADLSAPLDTITDLGMHLGIAFQIQDDLLNLEGSVEKYGKEIGGDIYEGKRTLMLNHVLAHSKESGRLQEILARPRKDKTEEDVRFVLAEMSACGSLEHGHEVARVHAGRAAELFAEMDFLSAASPILPGEVWEEERVDRRFLGELVNYVVYRDL
jgi:geranylgeranyl diphosphate synthase, type II